mmetsp:Transcript_18466/g.71302  ORF Transcript_18466/g.71302 Transcript_18466/m.71302 type:complete len:412 (-) Transcript_18466:28-1263(-)
MEGKRSFLRVASLNQLIMYITSTQAGNLPARQMVLATYKSFTTPEKLLDKLQQRYDVPMSIAEARSDKPETFIKQLRTRVVLVIKAWLQGFPNDFSDKLVASLREFEHRLVEDGYASLARQLSNPLAKLASPDESTNSLQLGACPDPKVPRNIFSPTLQLADVPHEEVARQATLLDHAIFARIKYGEMLQWSTGRAATTRSSSVAALVNRFNQIVRWVATSILKEHLYKERAKIVSYFLDIATFLHAMHSYNTLMAIYSGITHASVYRLKHTFNELGVAAREKLKSLGAFFDPGESYGTYRATVADIVPPFVPFLGAHLKILMLHNQAMSDTVEGKINFEKRMIMYESASSILGMQEVAYSFLPISQISVFLKKFAQHKDDADMHKRSLLLEPKGISVADLVAYEAALGAW